jgi:hypothetical protein
MPPILLETQPGSKAATAASRINVVLFTVTLFGWGVQGLSGDL